MKKFVFIGVSAKTSAVNNLFPLWMNALGVSAELEVIDMPLSSSPYRYTNLLQNLKADSAVSGVLITTHKTSVFEAARAGVDELTGRAAKLCEIGFLLRRPDGVLIGDAPDVIVGEMALERLLAGAFRKSCNSAVILGAGGAGVALTSILLDDKSKFRTVILTEINSERVTRVTQVFAGEIASGQVNLVTSCDADRTTALIEDQPDGALIINATGMGKDRPGSPVSSDVRFPLHATVWELNYRGALRFLELAKNQERERHLRVADGWYCFVCGWSYVLSVAFGLDWGEEIVKKFEEIATRNRK